VAAPCVRKMQRPGELSEEGSHGSVDMDDERVGGGDGEMHDPPPPILFGSAHQNL
jgi:hypothetical protein